MPDDPADPADPEDPGVPDDPARGLPRAGDGAAWVVDLDGVVWRGGEPIPGAGDAVALLRGAGGRVLFASNNSSPTLEELIERLRVAGIAAGRDEIVTSGMAAAEMLDPGGHALVVGDDGLMEALAARGVHATRATHDRTGAAPVFDAVVVGYTKRFDYDVLAIVADAVRAGARLIGTNEDAVLPTSGGLLPGTGAILAAVATASGATPVVAGKPHQPLATLITERVARIAAVVGDRPSTDGALARRLGVPYALVLTGVTTRAGDDLDPAPDFVGKDLRAVAQAATHGHAGSR
ncbi:MAG: HAD-IIA family hydrolase [Actinomycetota bacterium]|nr:HAD-IIA family hydrolase [Actinomycetota bacterium]